MLTQRMIDILKAIVEEFINTAEPIGSKTLVDKYHLPYSSATIRNDMADLERLGYLEKPHTSAGRVPSNKGYQYYCENLVNNDLDTNVKNAVVALFNEQSTNVEDAIKQSCKVISEMTNLASGFLGPEVSNQCLEHISAYPLDSKTLVAVFITNTGHTENKTFRFEEDVTSDDIKECIELLNDRLKGTPINQLTERLNLIKPILKTSIKQREMLFNAFYGAFLKFASETLYVQGSNNMIYQPEYADIEKLKEMVKMFDDPKFFKKMSKKTGAEVASLTNNGTELIWKDDMACVSSELKMGKGENDKARLMVVGPRRMNYEKVIALLDLITNEVNKFYVK